MNSRRRLIPEARDLALLRGARPAAGPAKTLDFVVIGRVLGAAQVEICGSGQIELRDAGHRKGPDFAEDHADSGRESGRRRAPDAQFIARRIRSDVLRAVFLAPRDYRGRGLAPDLNAIGLGPSVGD